MGRKEFFDKIDQLANTQDDQSKQKHEQQDQLTTQVKFLIEQLIPVFSEYKAHLESKGIEVRFEHTETFFSFLMYYKNGGHAGLTLERSHEYDTYQFYSPFTNDDGKSMRSIGDMVTTQKEWSVSDVETLLQKQIEHFFFYADRHGGYQKA